MGAGALVFYGLSAVMVGSAVMVITRRNTVHSAVFLVLSFLAMAGIFVLMEAEFVAAVQVLVYAGGIMVLFLFVVLLVNLEVRWGPAWTWQAAVGSGLAVVLVLFLLSGLMDWHPTAVPDAPSFRAMGGNLQAVGMLLYQEYLLPFELASVLLLVAMVGAVLLALGRR